MASVTYNNGKGAILKEDLDTVTLKAIFLDPAYTPDIDTDIYLSDISANRATNTTDVTLTGVTITVDNTDNRAYIDYADFTTGVLTTSFNAYAVYIDTGTASTSQLIGYIEMTDGTTTPKTFSSVAANNVVTVPTKGAIYLG